MLWLRGSRESGVRLRGFRGLVIECLVEEFSYLYNSLCLLLMGFLFDGLFLVGAPEMV